MRFGGREEMSEHELGGFLALGLAILPCIVILYKYYCWNKQYESIHKIAGRASKNHATEN